MYIYIYYEDVVVDVVVDTSIWTPRQAVAEPSGPRTRNHSCELSWAQPIPVACLWRVGGKDAAKTEAASPEDPSSPSSFRMTCAQPTSCLHLFTCLLFPGTSAPAHSPNLAVCTRCTAASDPGYNRGTSEVKEKRQHVAATTHLHADSLRSLRSRK